MPSALSSSASLAEATVSKQTFAALVQVSEWMDGCLDRVTTLTRPFSTQEVGTSWRALTIPVLEPLTADRVARVCEVVMGCLLVSVSVATTQSILAVQQQQQQNQAGGGGTLSR